MASSGNKYDACNAAFGYLVLIKQHNGFLDGCEVLNHRFVCLPLANDGEDS